MVIIPTRFLHDSYTIYYIRSTLRTAQSCAARSAHHLPEHDPLDLRRHLLQPHLPLHDLHGHAGRVGEAGIAHVLTDGAGVREHAAGELGVLDRVHRHARADLHGGGLHLEALLELEHLDLLGECFGFGDQEGDLRADLGELLGELVELGGVRGRVGVGGGAGDGVVPCGADGVDGHVAGVW